MSPRIPVLMYHHVSPKPGLVTVSPENFRRQMAWLQRQGWQTLSCQQLSEVIGGQPAPKKALLISFDDGYFDNRLFAYPVLQQYGLHAVIFTITGWMGEGPVRPLRPPAGASSEHRPAEVYDHRQCMAAARSGDKAALDAAFLRWSEVEEMQRSGVCEFHSHTHTHNRWDKTCATTDDKRRSLAEDLAMSRKTLQDRLGQTSPHLCWPQGYFDADYQQVARDAGFSHLYTTQRGIATVGTDPTAIPRIVVKDRGAAWLASRLMLYTAPVIGDWYARRG